jgi:hypothetical protein
MTASIHISSVDLPQVKIKEINVLFPELGKLFDNQKTAIDNILNRSWKRDLSSMTGSGRELVLEEIASKLEKQILRFKKGHIKLSECRKSSGKSFRVAIEITYYGDRDNYREKIRFYLPSSLLVKIGKDKYCPQWIFEEAKKKSGHDGKTLYGEYEHYPALTEPVWIGKQEWIDAHVSQFNKIDNSDISK